MDHNDWIIAGLVTGGWIFASAFVCLHPTDTNFATWAAVTGSITCVYKWLDIKDAKTSDAP